MNEDESKDVLKMLFAGYPTQRQKMSNADAAHMFEFYEAGLSDLAFGAVKSAVIRLARTSEFIPTVAAIRAAVGVVAHGMQRTGAEAWGDVSAAMRKWGRSRPPGINFTFEDPIAARVVKALNWGDMCASQNPDHIRARFIEAYDVIGKQERSQAQASEGATNPMLGEAPHMRLVHSLARTFAPPQLDAGNDDDEEHRS